MMHGLELMGQNLMFQSTQYRSTWSRLDCIYIVTCFNPCNINNTELEDWIYVMQDGIFLQELFSYERLGMHTSND